MRFTPSIFGQLIESLDRRQFQAIVDRHDGDSYDKCFKSWDHLVALIYAQFGAAGSLRALEASWNANAHHHYHLGCGRLQRSTLSDANKRPPAGVFAETFALLTGQLGRKMRREGTAMLRLIDSTPIPLGKLCDWAKSNGRIRGMKLHIVYDPKADCPRVLDITDANVNDAQIGRTIAIEAGATYRLVLKRDQGDTITLLTNDLDRSTVEIGQLYKDRWQIELLFRWIKQHLKIRRFLGYNDNAIRLQIFAAMIAYALLRIATRANAITIPILRFTDLVIQCLFQRKSIAAIDKPPPVNLSRPKPKISPDQMVFSYA